MAYLTSMISVRQFLSHDAGPFVQFVKYGVAGVMATCVQAFVFYLLASTCLQCLGPDDFAVKYFGLPSAVISDQTRAILAALATGIGFTVANIFCWLMNRMFVFRPGRHVWHVEFLLFFGVSLVALVLGLAVQTLLIHMFGWTTSSAVLLEILSSFAINYAVRKFFVFKG